MGLMRSGPERCPSCGQIVGAERRPLTRRQFQVLELIRQSLRERGVAPKLTELRDSLGLRSEATVHELLTALEAKGYVRREFNRERGLTLVGEEPAASAVTS